MTSSSEIEKLVLGGLMVSEDVRQNARGVLNEDCFILETNKKIWSAIEHLDIHGEDVDCLSVHTLYNARYREDKIDVMDIIDMTEAYVSGGLETHIRQLVDLSIRRKIKDIAYVLLRDAEDIITPVEEIQQNLIKDSSNLLQSADTGYVTLERSISEGQKVINENRNTNKPVGIKTGFSFIDKAGGFHPGDLVVIAAESSAGKTSLAMSICHEMIMNSIPCVFYSMEMTHIQLTARLVSMQSGVKSSDILYNPLGSNDYYRAMSASEYIKKQPLYYDDKSTSSFSKILSSIRNMVIKNGIKCVFIDYIQLIRKSERNMSDEMWIACVARDLKNLAKELGIAIVILSQLSRDRENPEPTVNRLRGSGQINEAADIVLLIYRPEYYNRRFPSPFENEDTHNRALIKIGKGRNIGVGAFTCTFIPELTMFKDENTDKTYTINNEQDIYEAADAFDF